MAMRRLIGRFATFRRVWLSAATIVLLGAPIGWWMADRTDDAQRDELLRQTRVVAQAVSIATIRSLTGSDADLANPVYQRTKQQLGAACTAIARCKYIYLMGRRADRSVFFYVDSDVAFTRTTSPANPGEVYGQASAQLTRSFDTLGGTFSISFAFATVATGAPVCFSTSELSRCSRS